MHKYNVSLEIVNEIVNLKKFFIAFGLLDAMRFFAAM